MEHKYKQDEIITITEDVSKKPCDVVAMTGYLALDTPDEHYRLYRDRNFNRYMAIGPGTIKAQAPLKDERRKGRSIVWLDASKCVVMCEEVPLARFQLQSQGVEEPGDEDLAYEYPRSPHH
jgi:hypothetical protein